MDREELKKKIVRIIRTADTSIVIGTNNINIIADALIDANIGDVSEMEKKLKITERALLNRAKMYVDMQGYPSYDVPVLASEIVVPEDLKNAEIELYGGKNNEQI